MTHYLKGNKEKAKSIVSDLDLTAAKPIYSLAKYVLLEDYENAIKTMELVDKDEDMVLAYKDWPLFSKFRQENCFKDKYRDIFGFEFEGNQKVSIGLDDILKTAQEMVDAKKFENTGNSQEEK